VPDHKGYGKSETPQEGEYSLRNHVENLIALIEYLSLENITFVCQDWGGPITAAYTLRHPEKVKRICMMNTMMGYGFAVRDVPKPTTKIPALQDSSWFQWVLKAHKEGYYRPMMERLGDHVLSNMKMLYFHNSAAVTADWLKAYSMPFESPEECKGAIEFPLDAALGRIKDFVVEGVKTGNLEKLRAKPAMLAEGMADKAMPPAMVMNDFKRLFPNGPIVQLENVGHFCQEDAPKTLVALIQQFIQMT
jgi:haloalkane dehalogenase